MQKRKFNGLANIGLFFGYIFFLSGLSVIGRHFYAPEIDVTQRLLFILLGGILSANSLLVIGAFVHWFDLYD